MLKNKHKILPVFIPFAGCRSRCIYCNQHAITDTVSGSIIESVKEQICEWQSRADGWTELAFYGGTFGNLPANIRRELYAAAGGLGVRYSTCPETVTDELVAEMKLYNVSTVELGVQSFSDEVLRANGRQYRQADIFTAFSAIPEGIKRACQLMVGMYTEERADIALAASSLEAAAVDYVRIYPTVALKNTVLAEYLQMGRYSPLSVEETLLRSAWLYMHAETERSRVIRIGLPPEAENSDMIAGGWWHPACAELVRTLLIGSWLRINKSALIPFHQALYGYKGLLKGCFDGLKLAHTDINSAIKHIMADLREYYREDKQWFTERANIDLAAKLSHEAHIR